MAFVCTKCQVPKPLTEYHKRTMVKRGHDSWCKSCKSEYRKDYFQRNTEKETTRGRIKAWKDAGIKITMEQYKVECDTRDNKCDICSRAEGTLNVDHCHITGKIRGFLCGSCNRALGLFQDKEEILNNAFNYLKNND